MGGGIYLMSSVHRADAQEAVLSTASFDHDCPKEKVTIISQNPAAKGYVLNVCGETRKYKDFGDHRSYVWVDVTDGPILPIAPKGTNGPHD